VDDCLFGLFRIDLLLVGGVMACCRRRWFWAVGPVLLANVMVFFGTLRAGAGLEVFSDGFDTLRTGVGWAGGSDCSLFGMMFAVWVLNYSFGAGEGVNCSISVSFGAVGANGVSLIMLVSMFVMVVSCCVCVWSGLL